MYPVIINSVFCWNKVNTTIKKRTCVYLFTLLISGAEGERMRGETEGRWEELSCYFIYSLSITMLIKL